MVMYINDRNISPTTMVMYINDRNIWVSSSSLKTNMQILQAVYKAISKKLAKSGLAIDTKKCTLPDINEMQMKDHQSTYPTPRKRTQPIYYHHHTSNG
jgi:hypothetical protein